jgi:hypothetical protein
MEPFAEEDRCRVNAALVTPHALRDGDDQSVT